MTLETFELELREVRDDLKTLVTMYREGEYNNVAFSLDELVDRLTSIRNDVKMDGE